MIRAATPADIETLVAITSATEFFRPHEVETLREVFDDYFESSVNEGHSCLTLDDGSVEGFAYVAPEPMTLGTWLLWWIVISPNVQRQGFGAYLLRQAEQTARTRGARILFIETSSLPKYEPTRLFYLKQGYEQEAILRDFYAAGDGKVVFRKSLV